MESSFNIKALLVSIVVGTIIVLLFAWASGSQFDTSLFPVLAMSCGFVITGFIIGIMTKGITIVEPGLGAIVVAIIAFFVIPALNIKGFEEINQSSDWIIILLNAVVLTFVGAWLGEMFQHGDIKEEGDKQSTFSWSWVIAGTVFGIIFSLIVAIIIDLIFGHNPMNFMVPFFIGLFITGTLTGLKSPGVTVRESGLSGFLTMVILVSIVRLTLVSEIEIEYLIGAIVLGFIVSVLGGLMGEKLQTMKENKK